MKIEKYTGQTTLSSDTIYTLPELSPEDPIVAHLLTTIKKRKIPINHERKNTGVGRSTTFGIAYKKFQGHEYKWCANNRDYPEQYDAILQLGRKVAPIPFYAIQANHNYAALPHFDINNTGHSTIFAVGSYKGGEFCIKDDEGFVELDICYKPILVDASTNLHWVNEVSEGDRYSFVYFVGKVIGGKHPSDVGQIYYANSE